MGIQVMPCCCGCTQATDFALVVSNTNQAPDDDQTASLGSNTIVSNVNFNLNTCCGYAYATDPSITLAGINKIVANSQTPTSNQGLNANSVAGCVTSTLGNTLGSIDPTWLVQGQNTVTIQAVKNNNNGNFGYVWLIFYWHTSSGYSGCVITSTYGASYPNSATYNFNWGSTNVSASGPFGPFTI